MSDDAKFVLILTVVAIVVGTAAVWTVSTASHRGRVIAGRTGPAGAPQQPAPREFIPASRTSLSGVGKDLVAD
jgi:hypothetical protein